MNPMFRARHTKLLVTLATLLFVLFITLAVLVETHSTASHAVTSFDHSIDSAINSLRTNKSLGQAMLSFTYLGNPEVIIAFEIALLAGIIVLHRKHIAILFLEGIVFAEALSLFFKTLLARARPAETIFHVSRQGYSFPSGHALLGLVFYGSLGFFAAHLAITRLQKNLITIFTTLIIFLIGVSRIFLGVHYASDVLAGWLLGGAVMALIVAVFYHVHLHTKGDHVREITKKERVGIAVLILMSAFFIIFYFVTHLPELRSIV